jgi:hypothetical protein
MSAVLDWPVLAVEYVADHAQRPPGLVGRLRIGETRQALDGLEVSLVRPGYRVGRDGDVEIWIRGLRVARALHAGAEAGAGGLRLLRLRRTVSQSWESPTRRNSAPSVSQVVSAKTRHAAIHGVASFRVAGAVERDRAGWRWRRWGGGRLGAPLPFSRSLGVGRGVVGAHPTHPSTAVNRQRRVRQPNFLAMSFVTCVNQIAGIVAWRSLDGRIG